MSTTKVPKADKPQLTDYRCVCVPDLKSVYVQLLNDNIRHLITYIYNSKDKTPYNSPDVRVALSIQMIMSSKELIPMDLSSMIAKDIDDLRKNDEYTSKWANPSLKRKTLNKELSLLKRHTELDDSLSLNLADKTDTEKPDIGDFDIHSGVSTLNVSAVCPIPSEEDRGNCMVM
mgnify:CR=1 FL=1